MRINTITSSQYPFLLQQISPLPKHLDVVGTIPSDDNKFLCVVGARQYSSYGEDACRKIIRGLQGYPIVIVSGLAIGIDSIAHETALEIGLKTVAFPGSGLSAGVIYPAMHRDLARRIVEAGGALISPFAIDQGGARWTFPVRNRLMAGMTHATFIIEAKKRSGTLITADYAAELNRDVVALPGDIFSELSYGAHMMMKRGAAPIASSADILDCLGFDAPDALNAERLPRYEDMSLTSQEKTIVDNLRRQSLSASDLIEKVAVSSSHFNILISELEIRGIVLEQEGRYKLK